MSRYQQLLNTISPAITILTPNQRLAAYLRKRYNEKKQTSVFNSADILPMDAWLHRLYETALMHQWIDKICLTSTQTLVLWDKVISEHPIATNLLSKTHKTAKLALSAWELLHAWQLSTTTLQHSHHLETEQFLTWLAFFEKNLKQLNSLTTAELPAYLLKCIPTPYYATLPHLHLVGFDEIPPILTTFFSTLQQHHVNVTIVDEQLLSENKNKIQCKNSLEELTLALQFSKNELIKNPHARIGIVIPELHHHRTTVIALCQKLFYPTALFQEPEINKLINISGGIPLSNTLLIQTILTVLKIKTHHIATPDLYWLWHSPYLNFDYYDSVRPLLECRLGHEHNKYISHATLMRFLQKQLSFKDDHLPRFYKALQAPPGHNPSPKSHQTWMNIFHQYLLDLGFPGNRALVSSDVQRLRAWEDILLTFASLDTIENKVSFDKALTQLVYLCQQKLFQAKSHDAPIQILGLLEASGQEYTHLWIMNLNEGALPQNPRPHPLLPIKLQKQLAMPHADAAREYQFSQKVFSRLLSYSDQVICSYSEENGDINLRPSPLIYTLPLLHKETLSFNQDEDTPTPLKTHDFNDSQGLTIHDNTAVNGGSYLFKLQAQCPFKAYATLRLRADNHDPLGLGLSPALRGSMVHQALHYFYQVISSQSQLLTLSKEEQHQLLQTVCQQALNTLHHQQPLQEHRRHYELESARLEKLLSIWLEEEKMRPHFTIVATEKRLEADFAGLQFKVQIDRIDKLDDGSEIIIDYKTGQVNINDWFSERPNEPQLPLYCSIYDSDIKAMAFAKVNLQKIGIEGIGLISDEWPAIKRLTLTALDGTDPWQQQKTLWRQQLRLLAEEFKQGYAAVSPKDGEKTCQYCHLPSLCRIRQHTILEDNAS